MNTRQRLFVSALFEQPTITAAAAAAGISTRTARTYLHNTEVLAALRDLESAALDAIQRRLVSLSGDAVTALAAALTDADAGAGVRVRAADLILQRLLQIREAVGVENRLAELEAMIGGTTR